MYQLLNTFLKRMQSMQDAKELEKKAKNQALNAQAISIFWSYIYN